MKLLNVNHNNTIKNGIRSLIGFVLSNDIIWYLCSPFFNRIAYLSFIRGRIIKRRGQKMVDNYFKDLTVKNGVFKGLQYPRLEASGSAIYPKLMGSYEAELQGIFNNIINSNYSLIVDIGCAEGYYLTGFGIKFPKAKLWGIDTSNVALNQCKEMLLLNHVKEDRFTLNSKLEPNLMSDAKYNRALIISDCEGYEEKLFTEIIIQDLVNHDILIECHDFICPGVTGKLINYFSETHEITIIKSSPEKSKLHYIPKGLASLSDFEKLSLLKEGRPCEMNWIFAASKHNNGNLL